MNQEPVFDKLFKIGVIVALIFLALKMNSAPPLPGPGPGPNISSIDVVAATHQADIHDAIHKAEAMEYVADKVDAKEINDAQSLMDEVRKLTELGRTNAYYKDPVVDSGESLGQIDSMMIPWETYDDSNRSRVSSYLRAKAKGHRSGK